MNYYKPQASPRMAYSPATRTCLKWARAARAAASSATEWSSARNRLSWCRTPTYFSRQIRYAITCGKPCRLMVHSFSWAGNAPLTEEVGSFVAFSDNALPPKVHYIVFPNRYRPRRSKRTSAGSGRLRRRRRRPRPPPATTSAWTTWWTTRGAAPGRPRSPLPPRR